MSDTYETLLQNFIDRHVDVVEPLMRDVSLAEWELQTAGGEEAQQRSAELNARLEKVYASKEDFKFLNSLDEQQLSDPMLKRQWLLLMNSYRGSQIADDKIDEMVRLEVSIAETFNTYRPKVQGRDVSDNEIDEILLSNRDSALRREAWLASKEIGALAVDRVLDLVRIRNQEAKRLGFSNYYAMSLTLQEQDEASLFGLLEELRLASDSLWQTYKAELDASLADRFEIDADQIQFWHHANRFFQEPGPGKADLDRFFHGLNLEKPAASFFEQIGLPIDDLLAKADLYERPGKCQHAFCMDVDRKGDVRVLCNNRPDERWMSTTLHEFGHAVYDKYVDRSLPFLLRQPSHTLTTEAIALLMGRFTKDASWLHTYASVDSTVAAGLARDAQRELRDHLLVFTRWCFVMCYFERALYSDPDQDLDSLWWQIVERYQGVSLPHEDRKPGMWASKIHLATAPVYYHNYLIGEMAASQILNHLTSSVLADGDNADLVNSPTVGEYMRHKLFQPGATRAWDAWIEQATGEPLNPDWFVQQLAV